MVISCSMLDLYLFVSSVDSFQLSILWRGGGVLQKRSSLDFPLPSCSWGPIVNSLVGGEDWISSSSKSGLSVTGICIEVVISFRCVDCALGSLDSFASMERQRGMPGCAFRRVLCSLPSRDFATTTEGSSSTRQLQIL